MRPNGGVRLEPVVRPSDMGRMEGRKAASGGQVEAGIHRWDRGDPLVLFTQTMFPIVNVNVTRLILEVPGLP